MSLIKQSFHFHPTRFQSEQLLDVPMKPAALLCPKFVLVMMTKENYVTKVYLPMGGNGSLNSVLTKSCSYLETYCMLGLLGEMIG